MLHPFKKTVVRIPGPSFNENRMISVIIPSIHPPQQIPVKSHLINSTYKFNLYNIIQLFQYYSDYLARNDNFPALRARGVKRVERTHDIEHLLFLDQNFLFSLERGDKLLRRVVVP